MFKSKSKKEEVQLEANTLSGLGVSFANDEQTSNVSLEQTSASVANFSSAAFSIIYLNNAWVVAEIPIDPLTKQTGNWILHGEDGTKMGAQERFKINVAKKLFN